MAGPDRCGRPRPPLVAVSRYLPPVHGGTPRLLAFPLVTRPRPRPGRQRRAVRIPGIVLVLVGAILVLLSFRFFDWYSVAPRADSTSEITFSALHNSADQLSGT